MAPLTRRRPQVARPADWYETQVMVADGSGFRAGDGVMVWISRGRWSHSAVSLSVPIVILHNINENGMRLNDSTALA